MPPKVPQAARKSTGAIRLRDSTRGRKSQRQPATKAANPKPAKVARKHSGSRTPGVSTGAQDHGQQRSTKAAHPTYWEMVKEAIRSLKQRRGSSQQALAKYLEKKYGESLPDSFRKTLSKRLMEWSKGSERLTKVKRSFKLK